MKANDISRPRPAELGYALGAVIHAKTIIDAHVEHRAISADEVRGFYEHLYDLMKVLAFTDGGWGPDELDNRKMDMLEGCYGNDEASEAGTVKE